MRERERRDERKMRFHEYSSTFYSPLLHPTFVSFQFDSKLIFSPILTTLLQIKFKIKDPIITWIQSNLKNKVQYRFLSRINFHTSDD